MEELNPPAFHRGPLHSSCGSTEEPSVAEKHNESKRKNNNNNDNSKIIMIVEKHCARKTLRQPSTWTFVCSPAPPLVIQLGREVLQLQRPLKTFPVTHSATSPTSTKTTLAQNAHEQPSTLTLLTTATPLTRRRTTAAATQEELLRLSLTRTGCTHNEWRIPRREEDLITIYLTRSEGGQSLLLCSAGEG